VRRPRRVRSLTAGCRSSQTTRPGWPTSRCVLRGLCGVCAARRASAVHACIHGACCVHTPQRVPDASANPPCPPPRRPSHIHHAIAHHSITPSLHHTQFELRYEETERARAVFERYVEILPSVKAWVRCGRAVVASKTHCLNSEHTPCCDTAARGALARACALTRTQPRRARARTPLAPATQVCQV
jgi:hypothetical protein